MGNAQVRVLLALMVLAAGVVGVRQARGQEDGFASIFDGQSLAGWAGDERFWRVEDGRIVGETTTDDPLEANTFLIWQGGEPGDFELKFRYRIASEAGNSGVQVRSEHVAEDEGYVVAGYQADIATDDWITGIHYEERGRGVLARRGQKVTFGPDGSKQVMRFADEEELGGAFDQAVWTEYHVIARGNRIVTMINGRKMHEIVDAAPQARREGVIAFQLHTGPAMRVEFEDVRLKWAGLE